MINPHTLPGSVGPFTVRRAVLTPRARRGRVVSFDAATWKASVQLDGAMAALNIRVGDWVNPDMLTAGAMVAVTLFNDSNPDDGLVLGTYGTVGGQPLQPPFYDLPEYTPLTIGDSDEITITSSFHTLVPGGGAASDYLNLVYAPSNGRLVFLRVANPAHVVSIFYNEGNVYSMSGEVIVLTGDRTALGVCVDEAAPGKWVFTMLGDVPSVLQYINPDGTIPTRIETTSAVIALKHTNNAILTLYNLYASADHGLALLPDQIIIAADEATTDTSQPQLAPQSGTSDDLDALAITGISPGAVPGYLVCLTVANPTHTITVKHNAASGTPGWRFLLDGEADVALTGYASMWLLYDLNADAPNGAWREVHRSNFDATAPTTQAFADAAVVGTAAAAARRDHKHAMMADPVTAHEAAYAHADIAGHIADAADAHDASAISILDTAADFTATDVEGALAELQADAETHAAAADPHAGYRLESADHSHASAGAQGGTVLLSDTTVSGLTDGQVLKATAATTKAWEDDVAAIEFIIDGGGSAITTGQKGHLEIPFACVITRVTTLADQSGSIVVDIWKDTYANFPPTVADTITAAAKPTLSAAQKAQDSTLTGWTTAIAAGDVLAYNVDSAATVTRVVISLRVRKT